MNNVNILCILVIIIFSFYRFIVLPLLIQDHLLLLIFFCLFEIFPFGFPFLFFPPHYIGKPKFSCLWSWKTEICKYVNILSIFYVFEDGVEIELPDKNGKTPLMLAMGRKHEAVISYLKRETKQRKSLFPRFDFWWVAE